MVDAIAAEMLAMRNASVCRSISCSVDVVAVRTGSTAGITGSIARITSVGSASGPHENRVVLAPVPAGQVDLLGVAAVQRHAAVSRATPTTARRAVGSELALVMELAVGAQASVGPIGSCPGQSRSAAESLRMTARSGGRPHSKAPARVNGMPSVSK